MLGEEFHSVVLRMAVHIERIAMILSALRKCSSIGSEIIVPLVGKELYSDNVPLSAAQRDSAESPSSISPEFDSGIVCSDEDYQIAELIGNKLILHMAQAYQLIKGTQKIETPAVKPLDQKAILLSLLPSEFESKTLVAEAQSQGISPRTSTRWNEEWMAHGLVQKIRYGVYKKIA
jgi:hypothetical protein